MPWTVNSLADNLRGILDGDADAPGGTAPDRVKDIVREQGASLWTLRDWRFRLRSGTLAVASGKTMAALPGDFAEVDHRIIISDDDYGYPLILTEAAYKFQLGKQSGYDQSLGGIPRTGMVSKDWSRDYPYWYVQFEPTSDAAYDYPFWYMVADPWSRHQSYETDTGIDDADLVFTARKAGPKPTTNDDGDAADIAVRVRAISGPGGGLSVSVITTADPVVIDIVIWSEVTTAAQVKAAVDADATISALVHCDYPVNQAGTGILTDILATQTFSGPLADTAYPNWPRSFDEGWRLKAKAAIQGDYGDLEHAAAASKAFERWLSDQLNERNETMRMPTERIEDAMGDFDGGGVSVPFPYGVTFPS